MQGATELAMGSSLGWIEHVSFVDQSGMPITNPQLIGGIDYILCASSDTGYGKIAYDSAISGDCTKINTEYTGGYPAIIDNGNDTTILPGIRCGVDPAAGGLSIPIAMENYKFRRAT
jgi:hypothetical protein